MNRNVLESQWAQVRDILRDKFSNLTDEDIRQINGRYDQLVAKLQQKYGYSREEAEERIRNWNFERQPNARNPAYTTDRTRAEESQSTFFKWLLGLGIPLVLLAAYFLSTERSTITTPTTPPTTQSQVVETPADRSLTEGLRSAFISQQSLLSELQNIQITARNGIVTLSGTVATEEQRATIANTAQRFPGVRQVVNNLQVR